jgi:2-keto-3-deoxy-L-rhamnonate aldolase RhmA
MRENRVKRILGEGGLALGTHVGGIADPQIVEIIGLAGFDAAFIDLEHTSFDLHDVQAMVLAAERVGITPIVRTPGFDPAFILRLLDMGVQGIQVPHIGDAETAREAVKAVRYPPEGERGMAAGSRAAEFGRIPLVEHMAQSNREILLACMIEDMAAVERIDEIAAVEGVDLLAVGPSDLSRSLGVSGQPDHPRLVAAIDRVREAEERRRPPRAAAQPCRLSPRRRPAQGARRQLHQLRADPGGAAAALTAHAGRRCPPAPRLDWAGFESCSRCHEDLTE